MNLHGNPEGSDRESGVALIAAAAKLLAKRKSGVPNDFVAKLFELTAPEDLRHCGAPELAEVAEQSWSFLAERQPSAPKIRFEPLPGARSVCVLEIINGATRATRFAKLAPGTLIRVEVIGKLRQPRAHHPKIGDRL